MNLSILRSSAFALAPLALLVVACSSSSSSPGENDASTDAPVDACAPLPCPSGAPWDPVKCACVAKDAGPEDAATDATGPGAGCTASGGSIGSSLCCTSASDFPDTCGVGACGCAPGSSHTVQVCQCPQGTCFDGTRCK